MTREEEFFDQFLAELTLGFDTNGEDGTYFSDCGDTGKTGWFVTPTARVRLEEILTQEVK